MYSSSTFATATGVAFKSLVFLDFFFTGVLATTSGVVVVGLGVFVVPQFTTIKSRKISEMNFRVFFIVIFFNKVGYFIYWKS